MDSLKVVTNAILQYFKQKQDAYNESKFVKQSTAYTANDIDTLWASTPPQPRAKEKEN